MQEHTVEELMDLPETREAITAWALTYSGITQNQPYAILVEEACGRVYPDACDLISEWCRVYTLLCQWTLRIKRNFPECVVVNRMILAGCDLEVIFIHVAGIQITSMPNDSMTAQALLEDTTDA